eukprot:CAMPEP_0194311742 /NCGR_PEP_ID=MMETSP0171-20130528/8672_1 /TAXON_ID=218684 /ORGANISM="Corethron pennatum, Strain L29A3" /LENGTH=116 /DNA_ID=CAMNT_0039065937 /DNA_START=146 /DNA_END=497 /DNA_ORIENTATION=+
MNTGVSMAVTGLTLDGASSAPDAVTRPQPLPSVPMTSHPSASTAPASAQLPVPQHGGYDPAQSAGGPRHPGSPAFAQSKKIFSISSAWALYMFILTWRAKLADVAPMVASLNSYPT